MNIEELNRFCVEHWARLVALVLAFGALVQGYGIWSGFFFDIDAPKYVVAAWEMVFTGDWLRPMFDGVPRIEKPPLAYWVIAPFLQAARALGGVDILAARLAGVLASVVCLAGACALGRRLFSPLAGLLCGVVLAASVLFKFMGIIVKVDIFFAACTTWASVLLLERFLGRRTAVNAAGATVWTGLAVLAKGPFGLIPLMGYGLAVAAAFLGDRKGEGATGTFIRDAGFTVLCATLGILPFLCWLAATRIAGGPDYLAGFLDQFAVNTVPAEADMAGRMVRLTGYFDTLVTYFFPWGPYVAGGVWLLAKGVGNLEKRHLFTLATCMVYLLLTLFLFRMAANRYLFPVMPFAAAYVCGWLLHAPRDKINRLIFDIASLWLVFSSAVLLHRHWQAGTIPVNLYFDFPAPGWAALWPLAVGVVLFFAAFIALCLTQARRPVRHILGIAFALVLAMPLYWATLPDCGDAPCEPVELLAPSLAKQVAGEMDGNTLVLHSRLFSQAHPDFVFFRRVHAPDEPYGLVLPFSPKSFAAILDDPAQAGARAEAAWPDRPPMVRHFLQRDYGRVLAVLLKSEADRVRAAMGGHVELECLDGLNVKWSEDRVCLARWP